MRGQDAARGQTAIDHIERVGNGIPEIMILRHSAFIPGPEGEHLELGARVLARAQTICMGSPVTIQSPGAVALMCCWAMQATMS
jgi:hypothetical protein